MKSKRAEEYIEDNVHDAADLVDRDGCGWAVVGRHKAYHAVELAEEDMAEKAAKAFCAVHCPKGCPFDKECEAIREFKQKMME